MLFSTTVIITASLLILNVTWTELKALQVKGKTEQQWKIPTEGY